MSTRPPTPTTTGRSVYGLRVYGLDHVAELRGGEGPCAAEVTVEIRQTDAPPPPPVPVDERRSVRRLADGRHLALDRATGRATFFGDPLPADLLAHPYLGPVATTFSRWAGRETFHAGAFVLGGRAWAVLGGRTAGKSSLLAALAARGVPVLTDDILVVDGRVAYAGPRCVDLRQPVPQVTADLRAARGGTRWRVSLPPVATRVPIGGWILLRWGPAPALAPVGATRLLPHLAAHRSWRQLPSDPAVLLALATLPAWTLTRPRHWGPLAATCRLLHTTLGAESARRAPTAGARGTT
ncbi:hypothetical protein [Micromonospora echinospora]|uniref:hypothetical protein n=1 Tax=Micromonospora echinospora TaxID=1877 RepID=UPI003A8BC79E